MGTLSVLVTTAYISRNHIGCIMICSVGISCFKYGVERGDWTNNFKIISGMSKIHNFVEVYKIQKNKHQSVKMIINGF